MVGFEPGSGESKYKFQEQSRVFLNEKYECFFSDLIFLLTQHPLHANFLSKKSIRLDIKCVKMSIAAYVL